MRVAKEPQRVFSIYIFRTGDGSLHLSFERMRQAIGRRIREIRLASQRCAGTDPCKGAMLSVVWVSLSLRAMFGLAISACPIRPLTCPVSVLTCPVRALSRVFPLLS